MRPWLFAITRHKVVDAFRARGRKRPVSIDVLAAETGPDPTEAADIAKMIGMLDARSAMIVRKIERNGAALPKRARH